MARQPEAPKPKYEKPIFCALGELAQGAGQACNPTGTNAGGACNPSGTTPNGACQTGANKV